MTSRNCTKHQVRCDYSETVPSDTESQGTPEQASVSLVPVMQHAAEHWQLPGEFPYPAPGLSSLQATQYTRADMQLINNLSSISHMLSVNGTSELTTWASRLPMYVLWCRD